MEPQKSHGQWKIPVVIVVIGAAIAGYYVFGNKSGAARVRDNIEVKITDVDVPHSKLHADFTHPKDGKTYPIVAEINSGCKITIDGAPAKLSDLKPGDHAIGKGSLAHGVVHALAIRVIREKHTARPNAKGDAADGSTAAGR